MTMGFSVASIFILTILSLHGGSCKSPHQAILGIEKVTQLHFYFHDVVSGDNPTAVEVVRANNTSPTLFGSISIFDDLLTEGPEPTSKVVGNAQGLYIATDKERFSLLFEADFEFTSGKFKGSSISIFSRNPTSEEPRELAVVGGRGQFRFARGVAELRTHFLNVTARNAIVEYSVTVLHYDWN